MHTNASQLETDLHEVVLTLTVTVKLKEKTAFLIEVKQAGIFMMKDFPQNEIHPCWARTVLICFTLMLDRW